ncbi:heme/hemin ABC transporter substrate-binding protein [Microbacterium indicum]|uniref:heme/hemin ABC transporter substrate-binding protein n=1 Tax=Microbacterium indicum TaxID=358100 RepID=UPI0003F8B7E4|nr:ABC transporter substrate-binding protein [Microbacterium indicum]
MPFLHPARIAAAAAIALAVLTASACTASGSAPSSDADATPALSSVELAADPLALTGPSTAVAAASPIDPVDDAPQALPVSVVDNQGTQVTVSSTDRILALDLYGSLGRIVFELGLGDSVVGRDVSTSFPEASELPLVTQDGHDLSAEAILALDPTVILTDTSLGPWDVMLQMRDAGIPVVVLDATRSTETVGSLIEQTADALGVSERGAALAERTQQRIDDEIAQIAAAIPEDAAARPRMAFLYVRGNAGVYYMFGEGTGAQSLVEALGGVDVAAEIGWEGMRPITDEGLISAAPDLVLLMTGGLESAGGVEGLLEQLPALAQTPAGENRRFVDMDDTQILSFGPATAETLDALAVAVYAPDEARS